MVTTTKIIDVVGIGNPLMDVLVRADDDKLKELGLDKGTMCLIDDAKLAEIESGIDYSTVEIQPGGSVANTLRGLAMLGASVVLNGKLGVDEDGTLYENKIIDSGVKSSMIKAESGKTGKAITFITADSQRTFATYLGVACNLNVGDFSVDSIKNAKYLHLTGYQLEDSVLRETSLSAIKIAKENDVKVSIDLADSNLVKRNLEFLRALVKESADVVFANEAEAAAFCSLDSSVVGYEEEALNQIAEMVDVAVVKIGVRGSMIKKDGVVHKIDAITANAVDTTGAGDFYASGVLYGLSKEFQLCKAGKLGSYISGKVVEVVGAKLDNVDKEELAKLVSTNKEQSVINH